MRIIKELNQYDFLENINWFEEVINILAGLSIGGSDRLFGNPINDLEDLLTKEMPKNLQSYFSVKNKSLYRIESISRWDAIKYIEKGELEISFPSNIISSFESSSSEVVDRSVKLANLGVGFMNMDQDTRDSIVSNGFAIIYKVPYDIQRITLNLLNLFELSEKLKINIVSASYQSLFSKAKKEKEVMILVNSWKTILTNKSILGLIEKDNDYSKYIPNSKIKDGSLSGYPLFPKNISRRF